MANLQIADLQYRQPHAHAFGNVARYDFEFQIAAAIADVVRVARVPKDSILDMDAWVGIDTGVTSLTFDFGYQHVDGSAGDDTSYYLTAPASVASTVFHRANSGKRVLLTKDSYIVLTVAGAALPVARTVRGAVSYIFKGHG